MKQEERLSRPSLRLRKNDQIRCVLDNGVLLRGKYVLARLTDSEKVAPPLFGKGPFFAVVISRKKEKRAVARNRMKRQLRAVFKKNHAELSENTAAVFVAKKVDKKISYQELEQDFLSLINKYREIK